MDKIKEVLDKVLTDIPYDKKLHFIAGFCLSILFGVLIEPTFGLLVGVAAGIAKEVYDYFDYGKFDAKDMLATWLGSLVAYGVSILVKMII